MEVYSTWVCILQSCDQSILKLLAQTNRQLYRMIESDQYLRTKKLYDHSRDSCHRAIQNGDLESLIYLRALGCPVNTWCFGICLTHPNKTFRRTCFDYLITHQCPQPHEGLLRDLILDTGNMALMIDYEMHGFNVTIGDYGSCLLSKVLGWVSLYQKRVFAYHSDFRTCLSKPSDN